MNSLQRHTQADYSPVSYSIMTYCGGYGYHFSLVFQVFQGLLRAHRDFHDTKERMARLWVHECFRVFSDRLVGDDYTTFIGLLSDKLGSQFELTFHNLCRNKQPPTFGDFMKEEKPVYEDLENFQELKSFLEGKLDMYNKEPDSVTMNMVLFRDAIEHGIDCSTVYKYRMVISVSCSLSYSARGETASL